MHFSVGQKQSNACVVVRGTEGTFLKKFSTKDQARVELTEDGTGGGKLEQLIIKSAYFAHIRRTPQKEVGKLVNYCRSNVLDLVVWCHANAHRHIWGSTDCKQRRTVLLEYLLGTNLELLNESTWSTFVMANWREVLDITLFSQRIRTRVKEWWVSEETSLSDHKMSRFPWMRWPLRSCGAGTREAGWTSGINSWKDGGFQE